MASLESSQPHSFTVRGDQPLIGVITQEGDEEVVRYFTDEQAAEEASALPGSVQRALALAGAWKDMDWGEALEDLDRIRHESKPTPPIEL